MTFKRYESYRICVQREFAFALVLYRFAHPRSYCTMEKKWGMNRKNMACIINQFSTMLISKFKYGLEFDSRQFSRENCAKFSEAIYEQCGVYKNIIGFIDRTMQKVCCRTNNDEQKHTGNGWKLYSEQHVHCIKYQAIGTPDGITSTLVGPFIGSAHDAKVFDDTNTLDRLILHLGQLGPLTPQVNYRIYGDLEYKKCKHVFRPYKEHEIRIHANGKYVNTEMAKVRVQVEIEFGKVSQYFKLCKSSYIMKFKGNTNPALVYILCTLFKNFHTCLNGSATKPIFGLTPPTIEEYISGLMRERQKHDTIDNVDTILNNASNLVQNKPIK
ncbi:hypothetical protein PHYBLDRAFT_66235 [Phycomyces blakesleeanus NRRL 1555(-)]|uniref:DDE Tnp4 domain-containing protein n=1 Tax=Phycomyces blakesleeanus (strain ATCC 8743b / DSM 1359 / FGSC 10004 / NBRC 33097 / NRRL 1555) TaxID=763407 RepID=A0A163D8K0_PHYB8|nr:hypothetical protein PHYBLDRAFT_66235 [Phycomyces blakesleeanus NRRL 1555(-)]OAD69540.1 hypothetical protein PHYBLDRAFT_66235 [Phycomyces blakesleeanus NRRL 1555(-)]|eukprot:XP_018287580.1 hypothetical protein PHYBLDRAFT_66235 [Phycomyces blakesleeanus NRRL 1555(-)]